MKWFILVILYEVEWNWSIFFFLYIFWKFISVLNFVVCSFVLCFRNVKVDLIVVGRGRLSCVVLFIIWNCRFVYLVMVVMVMCIVFVLFIGVVLYLFSFFMVLWVFGRNCCFVLLWLEVLFLEKVVSYVFFLCFLWSFCI